MPQWTDDQQQVIDSREKNMLVSAAAGSGKTAVLVERIIQRILDEEKPIDVDRIVVVTFTKAAAAEMRERILLAINGKLEEDPGNVHLMRQATLVHNAQITTIDSLQWIRLTGIYRSRQRYYIRRRLPQSTASVFSLSAIISMRSIWSRTIVSGMREKCCSCEEALWMP